MRKRNGRRKKRKEKPQHEVKECLRVEMSEEEKKRKAATVVTTGTTERVGEAQALLLWFASLQIL